ncbi:MAG: cupin domain-containing protein [Betaproteobacteria bacterium]|jgi:quercetin dioxygenase-like cupin family protein|nr:cupin domain-containing protein [Betaproteobacteria bacterium]
MTKTFEEFTAVSVEEGFDEMLVREWQPNLVIDTHTHPFDVSALVVRGEFVLTVGEKVITLKAGDPFRLARDIPHTEQYGPEGATVWVARAN